MDPFTIALLGGGLLSGIGGLFNQSSQNRWRNRLSGMVQGRLSQGPSVAEQQLLEWITGGGQGFDPSHLFTGEGYNSGQDSLMQMLRAEPFENTALFTALEPIERRALDQALAGAFAQAGGIGERFGSAMMREEGRLRGESAENAAARRAGIEQQTYESAQQRALNAAQLLGQFGQSEAALGLQALMGLGGLGQNRQAMDLQLLQMLAGVGGPGPNVLQGLGGMGTNLGQLLFLMPLLKGLQSPPSGPPAS